MKQGVWENCDEIWRIQMALHKLIIGKSWKSRPLCPEWNHWWRPFLHKSTMPPLSLTWKVVTFQSSFQWTKECSWSYSWIGIILSGKTGKQSSITCYTPLRQTIRKGLREGWSKPYFPANTSRYQNGLLLGKKKRLVLTYQVIYILFHTLHCRPRNNKPGSVPIKFVAFLRAALSKMAGYKYVRPELIDMEFWTKMPLKWSAVKFYDKSLVSIKKKKKIKKN